MLLYPLCVRLTAVLLALGAVAYAQDARGTINGVVSDSSGAAVPGSKVTARQRDMGTRVTTVTNSAGSYDLPFLLPGPYEVTVEREGFKTFTRTGLELRVGDIVKLNVVLQVGNVLESVTVTGAAPPLDTSTASIGQVIDHKRLVDLPLSGANVMNVATMAPHVTTVNDPGHNWLPNANDTMARQTVSGVRQGGSEYTLDGIPNMTRGDVGISPPPDMIQEFRIQTVSYDASYGHFSGGTFNTSLKTGTNNLHGTAKWDYAPEPFNSNGFFSNKQLYDLSTGPVTDEKRARFAAPQNTHRYSATASGPIVIPKLYNGQNRSFWTYGYQGVYRDVLRASYQTVPTEAQRRGDFSALLAQGRQFQIYDPQTSVPAAGGRIQREPFVNNIIPTSRISSTALKYLSYYPPPNTAGDAQGRNNFAGTTLDGIRFGQNLARLDHQISEKHRVFGRFTISNQQFLGGNVFRNGMQGFERFIPQNSLALDDVYVISPSLVANVKYGMYRFVQNTAPYSRGFDLTLLDFPQSLINQLDSRAVTFPQLQIGAFSAIGGEAVRNQDLTTTNHNLLGSLSQTRGTHTLKYGTDFRVFLENFTSYGNAAPLLNFGTDWTRGPLDNAAAAPIGQDLAALLLGLPTGGGVDVNGSRSEKSSYFGLFVQDDWKATRALTVTLGLRWEYESAPTERYDRGLRSFDPTLDSPIVAQVPELRLRGAPAFLGRGGPRNAWQNPKTNFMPRVGVAWQITPRTVIRSGYGIFFEPVGVDRRDLQQIGFSRRTDLVLSRDGGLTFNGSLANPFPNGIFRPAEVSAKTALGQALDFVPYERPTAYMQRWSFSVQRELPWQSVTEISYVGNRGTDLAVTRDYNPVPAQYLSTSAERDQPAIDFLSALQPNPLSRVPEFAGTSLAQTSVSRATLLRRFPQYTDITGPDAVGYTWYHSVAARIEKRFSHGFTAGANWTFSKFMEATQFLNPVDPLPTEIISPQDRTHRFIFNFVAELPVGRGRPFGSDLHPMANAVIGGWQVQGIYQYQTGAPIEFGNVLFRGSYDDIVLPRSQRTPDRWFNTDAGFERAAARQLQNNIRTFPLRLSNLRAADDDYWNLSALKEFRLTETARFQIRTDWEGAFNTPLFAAPNTAPTNSLFGQVTAQRSDGRRVYVGAKVIF